MRPNKKGQKKLTETLTQLYAHLDSQYIANEADVSVCVCVVCVCACACACVCACVCVCVWVWVWVCFALNHFESVLKRHEYLCNVDRL